MTRLEVEHSTMPLLCLKSSSTLWHSSRITYWRGRELLLKICIFFSMLELGYKPKQRRYRNNFRSPCTGNLWFAPPDPPFILLHLFYFGAQTGLGRFELYQQCFLPNSFWLPVGFGQWVAFAGHRGKGMKSKWIKPWLHSLLHPGAACIS